MYNNISSILEGLQQFRVINESSTIPKELLNAIPKAIKDYMVRDHIDLNSIEFKEAKSLDEVPGNIIIIFNSKGKFLGYSSYFSRYNNAVEFIDAKGNLKAKRYDSLRKMVEDGIAYIGISNATSRSDMWSKQDARRDNTPDELKGAFKNLDNVLNNVISKYGFDKVLVSDKDHWHGLDRLRISVLGKGAKCEVLLVPLDDVKYQVQLHSITPENYDVDDINIDKVENIVKMVKDIESNNKVKSAYFSYAKLKNNKV